MPLTAVQAVSITSRRRSALPGCLLLAAAVTIVLAVVGVGLLFGLLLGTRGPAIPIFAVPALGLAGLSGAVGIGLLLVRGRRYCVTVHVRGGTIELLDAPTAADAKQVVEAIEAALANMRVQTLRGLVR